MQRFDGVGGVDGGTHVVRVFEIGRQGRPFAAPGFDHHRVFGPSAPISSGVGTSRGCRVLPGDCFTIST